MLSSNMLTRFVISFLQANRKLFWNFFLQIFFSFHPSPCIDNATLLSDILFSVSQPFWYEDSSGNENDFADPFMLPQPMVQCLSTKSFYYEMKIEDLLKVNLKSESRIYGMKKLLSKINLFCSGRKLFLKKLLKPIHQILMLPTFPDNP